MSGTLASPRRSNAESGGGSAHSASVSALIAPSLPSTYANTPAPLQESPLNEAVSAALIPADAAVAGQAVDGTTLGGLNASEVRA